MPPVVTVERLNTTTLRIEWTGGDGPFDAVVYRDDVVYARLMGIHSPHDYEPNGLTIEPYEWDAEVGDRTPGPDAEPEDTRLAWIPGYGEGCLTGLTVTGRNYNTELAKITAVATGYTPAMSREFFAIDEAPTTIVNRCAERRSVGVPRIMLNFTSRNAAGTKLVFTDITSGVYDSDLTATATALEDNDHPVLLQWYHEPHAHVDEVGHLTASTAYNYEDGCEAYRAAYRHIIEVWSAANTKTTYGYQSTEFRLSQTSTLFPGQSEGWDCYPGSDVIDMVGYTGANGNTAQNPWKSPAERLAQAQFFLTDVQKPAYVAAGGSAEGDVVPTDKVDFYDDITAAMQSEGLMRLYVMVSTEFTDTGSVQWVDTSSQALAKWQEVVQRDYHNP